jgi:hypothetical protein
MEVVRGGHAHGVSGGCTVFSISSSGCSHQCISRRIWMSRKGEWQSECQGLSYSRSSLSEAMECPGIGYEEGHRRTTGCVVGRERRRRVYLHSLCVSRTTTGGRVASLCRAVIRLERKALSILRRAAFCCSCRVVSIRTRTYGY